MVTLLVLPSIVHYQKSVEGMSPQRFIDVVFEEIMRSLPLFVAPKFTDLNNDDKFYRLSANACMQKNKIQDALDYSFKMSEQNKANSLQIQANCFMSLNRITDALSSFIGLKRFVKDFKEINKHIWRLATHLSRKDLLSLLMKVEGLCENNNQARHDTYDILVHLLKDDEPLRISRCNATLTILGSCRQDSLYKKYNITKIKNELSYPHYSKEVLQVIKYCKFDNLKPEETMIFRTPIMKNKLIYKNPFVSELEKSDVIIIEIASRKFYKYEDFYVHHILHDEPHYNRNKIKIETGCLTDEDIIRDMDEICDILSDKHIIFVGHLVTRESGERYKLLKLIQNYCGHKNIPFIDPMHELLQKKRLSIREVIADHDTVFAHYTEKGHHEILQVYETFITKTLNEKIF